MPTVSELITSVRDALDEPTPAQFSDDMLVRWLNEANADIARSTRGFKDSTTFPVIPDNSIYPLPPEVIAVEHCYYYTGGQVYNLHAHHFEDFDALRHGYGAQLIGTPAHFSTFGFTPNLFLLVFPTPSTLGDSIEIFAARMPAPMLIAEPNAEVDTLGIWYDALVDYCEYKALRRDRDPRWQEAYGIYKEKRDGMIHNPDYLPVSRGVVPTPGGGWLPEWLISFD